MSRDWWSLRPLANASDSRRRPVDVPWARNPIDAFILAKLEEKRLRAGPGGRPPARSIRRLSFDLLGLPPTPDEVDAVSR